jgi:flagellar biosynthesis protein FliR
MIEAYTSQIIAALLVSLRIAPTLAFAPPFTLLRVPVAVRLLLSLGLALWIVLANPAQTSEQHFSGAQLLPAFASELLFGIALALGLQLAFAAILMVGRAIDIQVGFALAQVADPTLRSQMPLVGTLFAYAAAAVFFATGGPADLLAIWSLSVDNVPIGAFAAQRDLSVLLEYISAVFVLAVGLAGLVLLILFLLDLTIAFLSRTLPQMNVLVLGFQVKTLALLITLPFVFAFSGALFLRIVRLAIDATARMA